MDSVDFTRNCEGSPPVDWVDSVDCYLIRTTSSNVSVTIMCIQTHECMFTSRVTHGYIARSRTRNARQLSSPAGASPTPPSPCTQTHNAQCRKFTRGPRPPNRANPQLARDVHMRGIRTSCVPSLSAAVAVAHQAVAAAQQKAVLAVARKDGCRCGWLVRLPLRPETWRTPEFGCCGGFAGRWFG